MVRGNRELIAGLVRDPQFGATVMFGVGGVLAEAVADVVFRPAPLDVVTAEEMIDSLASQRCWARSVARPRSRGRTSSNCWSGWGGWPRAS